MTNCSKVSLRQQNSIRFFVYAFVLSVLSASISCNIEKRVERQQRAFDNIGRKWLSLHPCANDSTFIYIPGKRDSVPLIIPVLIKDSASLQNAIDSIQEVLQKEYTSDSLDCRKKISYSYKAGYNSANADWQKRISNIKIPTATADTFKITLKDKQYIGLLQSDLSSANNQIAELKIKLEKNSGKKNSWFLLFLIACMVAVTSIYFNIKKYF